MQTDITDRHRREAALQQQAEQERRVAAITKLSADVAQRIRRSLDLDDVLQTTVTEVRQFLRVDRVFIYCFDADWSGVVAVESVGSEWTAIQGMRIKDSFFGSAAGRELYQQGRVQAVEDVGTAGLSVCHLNLMTQLQVKANLVVPILQQSHTSDGDHLWGLLVAQHCTQAHPWQSLEIDLLSQLGSQVGIAIQQAQLYQQVQRLNANLEQQVQERTTQLQQALNFEALLKRITDQVRDTLDERQILQAAIQELSLGLGVDHCDTALYGSDPPLGDVAAIRYEYHRSSGITVGDRVLPMCEASELYAQLLQGSYTQFCRLRVRQGWRAVLACPIFDDRGTLGDLWLYRSKGQWFNESEVRLVQQVATQCGIALRQARFHQAIQAQLGELEQLNRLKDDFISTVSHELRSPVCNMKMAIQMLESTQQELTEGTEQTRSNRYLKILRHECDREIRLINDLLDLQKLDSDLPLFSPAAIELPLWLAQVVKPFQERARQRRQSLELRLSPRLPILVSDRSGIERILDELLTNACKYTPSQEQIIVAAQAQPETICLSVCSTGVEIPIAEQSRIFDKFYRISPDSGQMKGDSDGRSGTGLGLALVKKLTQRLGGKVWVESRARQTCFFVELPIGFSLKEGVKLNLER